MSSLQEQISLLTDDETDEEGQATPPSSTCKRENARDTSPGSFSSARRMPPLKYSDALDELAELEMYRKGLCNYHHVGLGIHVPGNRKSTSVLGQLHARGATCSAFSGIQRRAITSQMLPTHCVAMLDQFDEHVFCGQFSETGNKFVCACMADCIRVYDTTSKSKVSKSHRSSRQRTRARRTPSTDTTEDEEGNTVLPRDIAQCGWQLESLILPQAVGWAVVDFCLSPNSDYMAYTSWSSAISMVKLDGTQPYSIELHQYGTNLICLFSVKFSRQGTELVGGASDNHIYIADLESGQASRIRAHNDDVNSVCFAEDDGHVIVSGSDDNLIKIWDRRTLRSHSMPATSGSRSLRSGNLMSQTCEAVGVLQGHTFGVTHVTSRGDSRLILSNSKDQSAKLWDLRMMRDEVMTFQQVQEHRQRHRIFDYRWDTLDTLQHEADPNDTSLRTFRGHRVLQTLIRAYFTPQSMGAAHVVVGSFDGTVRFYDIMSGKTARVLQGHKSTVRDVSMHPQDGLLATSSWDGKILLWNYADVI